MKKIAIALPLAVGLAFAAFASPLDVVSYDEGSQREYESGWSSDKNGGSGFGKWNLQTKTTGSEDSHAGFYVASPSDKPDLNGIATEGKAFGLYANGVGFEAATAFRAFDRPLQVGQSFSWLMEHGEFVRKFGADSKEGGACGVTLLPDVGGASGTDDYNRGARFEFGYSKTAAGYEIHDGDGSKKLDVPFTDGGLAVTFTLVTADAYELEVTVLSTRKTHRVGRRKLSGAAGGALGGFCLFDRNGETNDVYFNGFQVLQKP